MKTKQPLFFLTVVALVCSAIILFSCSKDDDPGTKPAEKKQLVLSASSTQIEKGSEVTFDATVDAQHVEATIFLNGNAIAGNTFTFPETGSYSAVAKSENYLDSSPLIITVIEAEDQDDVDIYIAGMEKSANGNLIPKYWKNGVEQELALGQTNGFLATCIFVDTQNDDVYVGGHCYAPGSGNLTATIWKNGEQTLLSDGSQETSISAISVLNGNVYAVGSAKYVEPLAIYYMPIYWENGVRYQVADRQGYGTGIDMGSDGRLHILSYAANGGGLLWRDGTETPLEDSQTCSGLFIANNTAYVSGRSSVDTGRKATFWVNGSKNYLSTVNDKLVPENIFVLGGDIYVAGWSYEGVNPQALYWKNSIRTNLTDAQQNGLAKGVAVVGTDVYIVGEVINPGFQEQVALWKNGELTYITDGTRSATSTAIVVVEK